MSKIKVDPYSNLKLEENLEKAVSHSESIENLIRELYEVAKESKKLEKIKAPEKQFKPFEFSKLLENMLLLWTEGKEINGYKRRKVCRTAYIIKWLETLGYKVDFNKYPIITSLLLSLDAAINYTDDSLDTSNIDRTNVIKTYSFLFQLPYLFLSSLYTSNKITLLKNLAKREVRKLFGIFELIYKRFSEWYFNLLKIPFTEENLYKKFSENKNISFEEKIHLYDVRKRDIDIHAEIILEISNVPKKERERVLNILRDLRAYQLITKDFYDQNYDRMMGVRNPVIYFSSEDFSRLKKYYSTKILSSMENVN
ncbi:MAG: hypothetical protein QXQ14_00490 [Candidatus Aenigmatarchaeota archaeon]